MAFIAGFVGNVVRKLAEYISIWVLLNLIKVAIVDGRTIPHDVTGTCGKASVLLKSAKPGTGVIAGGTARVILELAGVKDVVSKSLGSNTKVNVAKATISALKSLRTKEHIASLRGKKVEEL